MEILLRLPVRSIVRFKCVCRTWYSIINSPNFIAQHQLLPFHSKQDTNNLYLLFNFNSSPPCPSKYTQGRISYNTLKPVRNRNNNNNKYPHGGLKREFAQWIIVSVDISTGAIIKTLFPTTSTPFCALPYFKTLVNYNHSLALFIQVFMSSHTLVIHMWVLEGEFGVQESWKKQPTVIGPFPHYTAFVLGFWKDGKVLLHAFNRSKKHKTKLEKQLLLFDPATGQTTPLPIYFNDWVFIYRETLVPLH